MRTWLTPLLLFAASFLAPLQASAQLRISASDNLEYCKQKLDSLCDLSRLTQTQRAEVRAAQRQVNLGYCLQDLRSLCRRDWLTEEQKERVATARRRHNLNYCMQGLSSLCDRSLLSEAQKKEVTIATRAQSRDLCKVGVRSYCESAVVGRTTVRTASRPEAGRAPPQDAETHGAPAAPSSTASGADKALQDAETHGAPSATTRADAPESSATAIGAPACAENGSCYGDVSAETGRPKTVHVRGYYRKDGTYVRGHYRSRPRK